MATQHTTQTTDASVTIGSETYELILTTKATRLIAERYGGLEHLGQALEESDDLATTLGEVIWLVTILANQSVLIDNRNNPDKQRPLLTEDDLELLTVPADLASFKDAISHALTVGTRQEIRTQPAPKDKAKKDKA